MITKTRANIQKDVRIILDQNETNSLLSLDSDQLQTDGIINKVMDLARDKVLKAAPVVLVSEVATNASVTWDTESDAYSQSCNLPNDLLRVISVRLSGWDHPVADFIEMTDEVYLQYRSEFAGIRPTSKRPGCAIVPSDSAIVALEAYPNTKDASGVVKYIPVSTEGSTSISLPNQVYGAYLYEVASLYYTTLGQNDMAERMEAQAVDMLGMKSQPANPS